MDDRAIIALFFARDERAIDVCRQKYGSYCLTIARRILANDEDAEECLNDAFLSAWESIPPQDPQKLAQYLGKLTRNAALDRLRASHAEKRGGGAYALAAEELAECLPSDESEDAAIDAILLRDALDRFLSSVGTTERRIFLRRYWYMASLSELAKDFGMSENRVGVLLYRTRQKLKSYLTKEGII